MRKSSILTLFLWWKICDCIRYVTWNAFIIILVFLCRPSSGHILEALHIDPASGVSLDKDRKGKLLKTTQRYLPSLPNPKYPQESAVLEKICSTEFANTLGSTSSALAKLNKATSSGSLIKQQGEKKETPQERLKRIMDKQLNKQSIIFLMLILEVKHSIHYLRCCCQKERA